MAIIQLIGLPCSGKTTFLKKYLSDLNSITWIDYAEYDDIKSFFKDVKSIEGNLIIESACGFHIKNSIVLLYKRPIMDVYKNHQSRNESIDEDYLSLLETRMIKPHYIITTESALSSTLDLLMQIERDNATKVFLPNRG